MEKNDNITNFLRIALKCNKPIIDPSALIFEGVKIIGDVEIGAHTSIWYNSVIRGDVNYIRIGSNTNIQDLSMLHVTNGRFPLEIGNFVTIAHSVALHGSIIGDNILIGIGAILLDGSKVSSNSIIAAGAVVREGFIVPERSLVAGVPAKVIREIGDDEVQRIKDNAINYVEYAKVYKEMFK
jgi:carbonic anhydrase/acetyltransferase-like protein (isoleucine patch superfamily)